MDVVRANFGTWVSPSGGEAGSEGIVLYLDRDFCRFDGESVRRIPPNEYPKRVEPESGPYEIQDFGSTNRLAWAAGACALDPKCKIAYWGNRYAIWVENPALVIADATRSVLVRITCEPLLRSGWSLATHAGRMWLGGDHAVVIIPLVALEALFEREGALAIEVAERYPIRKHELTASGRVLEAEQTHAKLFVRERVIKIPAVEELRDGMEVTLHDELWRDLFVEITPAGARRRALYSVAERRTLEASVAHTPAVDPAFGRVTVSEAPVRQQELDQLFSELASNPDDDAIRLVLTDILAESGEPYAVAVAELLAGKTDDETRNRAIGTLANFVRTVEYRRGLPWSGVLLEGAPREAAISDAVAADPRLGWFHELRLGAGNGDVYAKLVGSPRARGLRRVDAPNGQVLAALIAGERREVTHLYSVKFTTRAMLEQLADTTFDRVQLIETATNAPYAAKLLDFIAKDELRVFARAPRHLALTERGGNDHLLATPVLAAWPRLPLAAITFAGITLERTGTATSARAAPEASPAALAEVQKVFAVAR